MSFAEWKERSKLYKTFKDRAERFGIGYEKVAQAAYKAGERDGRKQVEAVAENAIRLAVLAERERCANICDHEHGTAGDAADKIRMRSNVRSEGVPASLALPSTDGLCGNG